MRLLIYTSSWKSRLIHSPFSIIVCHSSTRNNRRSALFDRTLRLWKQNLYYFQLHFSYFIAEFFTSAIKEDKKLSVWKKNAWRQNESTKSTGFEKLQKKWHNIYYVKSQLSCILQNKNLRETIFRYIIIINITCSVLPNRRTDATDGLFDNTIQEG